MAPSLGLWQLIACQPCITPLAYELTAMCLAKSMSFSSHLWGWDAAITFPNNEVKVTLNGMCTMSLDAMLASWPLSFLRFDEFLNLGECFLYFFSCWIWCASLAGTSRVLHHCLFILGPTSSSSSSSKSSSIALSSGKSDLYPGHTATIRLGNAGQSGALALVPLLPSALGSCISGGAAFTKFLMNWEDALLIKVSKKAIYSEVFIDLCF